MKLLLAVLAASVGAPDPPPVKLLPPASGVYHAAFPFPGDEDGADPRLVRRFGELAGKRIAWAEFSDNWFGGIRFPAGKVRQVWSVGHTVPYVRMMPRANWNEGCAAGNPYSMQSIVGGRWDRELRQYARDVKATRIPIVIDFAVEANGDWFPWSGVCNGGATKTGYGSPLLADGPERFRDAYRHVIALFRAEGVRNVTWMFHLDAYAAPEGSGRTWNRMRAYYPGDSFIDWLGVSVYAAQTPADLSRWNPQFRVPMSDAYRELAAVSRRKPIAVAEWGQIEYSGKARWLRNALADVAARRWPRVRAISYWHSRWERSNMRIDSSAGALSAYRSGIARSVFVGRPRLSG